MDELDVKRWRATFVRKIFAISSAIQGLAWTILALICIVLYYVKPESISQLENEQANDKTSFTSFLSFCLYNNFLSRNSENPNPYGAVIYPLRFYIICWIYLVLSIAWSGLSVAECLNLFKGKSGRFGRLIQIALGTVTLLVCTLDVVIFALALYDFSNINIFDISGLDDGDNDHQENTDYMYRHYVGRKISYGVLLTLAARGFVLWVINATAGFYSIVTPIQVFQMPPLLQYEEPIPRPKLKPPGVSSIRSDGFHDDVDGDIFSSYPPEKRNWYYQEAPKPIAYHERNNVQPRFANTKNRTSSGGYYPF